MLKLLKAKVLGGTSTSTSPSFHIVSEKQPAKLQHIDDDTHNNNVFMPFEFDIIDIDSTSSSQQSSTETRQPPDTVDVHKSFSMSYRSSAAAKEYTLIKTVNVGSTAKVRSVAWPLPSQVGSTFAGNVLGMPPGLSSATCADTIAPIT
jgi:hypothetical protein